MKTRIKESLGEKVFLTIVVAFLILSIIICLYPFIYVVSMSISDPIYVAQQSVWFLPKGFSTKAYETVFQNKEVWRSYYNTIWYTVVGTALNIFMTVITAYPLSRKGFSGRKPFNLFMIFTMFFSGGLIPLFILINSIKIYDTKWAIVLPAALSAWNVIITKTFFQSIPESLQESAKIDGCNDLGVLFRIILPLSMPIIAVVGLFSAVGFWNSYFSALIYLPNAANHPLQMYLMKVVIQNSSELMGAAKGMNRSMVGSQIKYAIIIVSILPIVCVYPFLQKYFIKGVMIGAVKE